MYQNNSTMNCRTIEFITTILTQKFDNGSFNQFIRFEFQLHMDGFLKDISKAQNYWTKPIFMFNSCLESWIKNKTSGNVNNKKLIRKAFNPAIISKL